jgi:hypothetical protein
MVRRSLFWGTWPYRGGAMGQGELRNDGVLRSSSMILPGAPTTRKGPGLANNLSELRSDYPDGVLALGVCGGESTHGFPGLIEAIGVLDGNSEGPGLQQPTQAF